MALTFYGFFASAEVRIDITQGVVSPIPIAITEFNGSSSQERQVGADIAQVITSNLESSGLFKPIDRKAFLQQSESLS